MRVGRLDFQDGSINKLGVLEALAAMAIGSGTQILTSTSTNGETTGTLDFQHGSSANGSFLRLGNCQVCWIKSLRLNFASITSCTATWTFPAAFKTATVPILLPGNPAMSGATPNDRDISTLSTGSAGNTSAIIRIFRVNGNTDFASGNFVDVDVLALGEWQ